jgi:hypothetical protein
LAIDSPGEVQHRVEPGLGRDHLGGVPDVQLDEGGVGSDRLAEAGDQAVQDGDLVAGVEQQPAGDAADVAGTPGDEQFHVVRPFGGRTRGGCRRA